MPFRCFAALVLLLFVASCGGEGDGVDEVNIFAAASLADAFVELEQAFEAQSPGVDIRLNVAGSSALREQILAGAPADVFASANLAVMDEVVAAGAVAVPESFVSNAVTIGVPAGNPAGLLGVADFEDSDLLLGVCATGVPCGDAALQLFENASIEPALDTTEPDVGALVTKLAAGELDAGIVYRSDTTSNDDVDGISLPDSESVQVTYPIALLSETANAASANAFIDFVFSNSAAMILEEHGFVPLERAP